MKLWILEPQECLDDNDNPWRPWYDKTFGFVVRAETEAEARAFADNITGHEHIGLNPWLDNKYSSCIELVPEGILGIVMRDFSAA